MKTSELIGKDLDYWVAKAQGWEWNKQDFCFMAPVLVGDDIDFTAIPNYSPSTNPAQAMELVKKYRMMVRRDSQNRWLAKIPRQTYGEYDIDLEVAICRAVVASVYGDEVDVIGGE
jgi:hypothetical protein